MNCLRLVLRASPNDKDWFGISDYTGDANVRNITVGFAAATQNLHGSAQDYLLDVSHGLARFYYVAAINSWVVDK